MSRTLAFAISSLIASLPMTLHAQEADSAPLGAAATIEGVTEEIEPSETTVIKAVIVDENGHEEQVANGFEHLQNGRAQDALDIFSNVIAAYEEEYGNRLVRCVNSPGEAIIILAELTLLSEGSEEGATALGPNWCLAIFGKGFALIDVNRSDEALPFLVQAVTMAPLEAHYLNELAEWHKTDRNWQESYDLFSQAFDLSENGLAGTEPLIAARSLRGMGFNMIELGDLNRAKELMLQSQELDPDSRAVRVELEYIASLQAKQGN